VYVCHEVKQLSIVRRFALPPLVAATAQMNEVASTPQAPEQVEIFK
jgi:hypothetical protein